MGLNVGVVGAGNIGAYHIERLSLRTSGATVSVVFDVAQERAAQVAAGVGAKAAGRALDLIGDSAVDAAVIASPGELHAEQVLACLDAGKPVLCEKPLATTTADCLKVVEAEKAMGRRMIQVGFMRRYDPAYLQVKSALDAGELGDPLLMHCVHRNPTTGPGFTRDMALTDSVVHEMDTTRWLLGQEVVSVSVRAGRRSPLAGEQDPQLVMFETAAGVLVDVESFVNCQYGYDVRCELVGSQGVASVDNPALTTVTGAAGRRNAVPADWKERFGVAFDAEFQDWVDGVTAGDHRGASAWDGYAATAVAEAGLSALESGDSTPVRLLERPSFYA